MLPSPERKRSGLQTNKEIHAKKDKEIVCSYRCVPVSSSQCVFFVSQSDPLAHPQGKISKGPEKRTERVEHLNVETRHATEFARTSVLISIFFSQFPGIGRAADRLSSSIADKWNIITSVLARFRLTDSLLTRGAAVVVATAMAAAKTRGERQSREGKTCAEQKLFTNLLVFSVFLENILSLSLSSSLFSHRLSTRRCSARIS